MKKNDLILSICLITRNQPERVDLILKNLSYSLPNKRIELIVNDGSSDKLTQNVLDKFQTTLNINRNNNSLRTLDYALIDSVQNSNGEFIWCLGDDIPSIDALKKILSILEKDPCINFLWLNSHEDGDKNKKAFHLVESKYVKNAEDMLEPDIGMLGFISSAIYRREYAKCNIQNSKKFDGSVFVSLHLALSVLKKGGPFYLEAEPLISSRAKLPGEKRWYDPYKVFGINIKKITDDFKYEFNEEKLNKALKKNIIHAIKAIIYERTLGYTDGFASSKFNIIEFFSAYKNFPSVWVYIPILYLPKKTLSYIRLIFNIFFKYSENLNLNTIIWKLSRRGYIFARNDSNSDQSRNGEFYVFSVLCKIFKNEPIIFDIGANQGNWLVYAKNILKNPKLKIIAIEPSKDSYEFLINKYKNEVNIFNIGLGEKRYTEKLLIYGKLMGLNSLHEIMDIQPLKQEEIQILTYDQLVNSLNISEVDYVKSDTEGNCFNILKGAETLLKKGSVKFWQFEYNYRWLKPGHSLLNVFNFIEDKPYFIGKINKSGIRIYKKWHFEMDRYFEANFILIRKDLISNLPKTFNFYEYNYSNIETKMRKIYL